MQQTKMSEYLQAVCDQIRWKKAHPAISEEIEHHIEDQRDALLAQGLTEDVALEQSIKEMGDPVQVGSGLDRVHRPKTEWRLLVLMSLIVLLGLVIRLYTYPGDINVIIYTLLGIGGFTIAYFVDFTLIGKNPKTLYAIVFFLSFIIFIKENTINGHRPYLPFLPLLFPSIFAGILFDMRKRGYWGIVISLLFFLVPLFIALLDSNYVTTFICLTVGLILANIAIAKNWFQVRKVRAFFLFNAPVAFLLSWYGYTFLSYPYNRARFAGVFAPTEHTLGITQFGILKGANFWGQGDQFYNLFFSSQTRTLRAPFINDYLLTYLIYKYGYISFVLIMALLVTFIVRAFRLCQQQKSTLGRLISTSVLCTFTLQVAVYVASNLGFQPTFTLGLPLLSYGNVSLVVNLFLLGTMLSVFKSGDAVRDHLVKPVFKRKKSDLSA